MKKVLALTLATIMLLGVLCGCNAGSTQGSGSDSSAASSEVDPADTTIAVCMGAINHPVHRIAQMGFIKKGQELGYNAIVSGLDEGSSQELIAKYESTITNGCTGVMLWTGDDGLYEMMRNLVDQCYFVVPHFAHTYTETKSFISRNITSAAKDYGAAAADFIVERLQAKGVTEGVIGITQNGPNVTENAANDAFRSRIKELGVAYTCASTIFEGSEVAEAATKVTGVIQANPGIVAGFGTTGGSAQSWATAMQNTNHPELIVVATDYTELNQDLVLNGSITGIICQPLYDEAQECAVSLDAIFHGTDFTASEDQWLHLLDAPIAYVGGEGLEDINAYRPIVDELLEFYSD